MQSVGSRAQVMHGNAKMTGGGLKKKDLKYNNQGKIVSKKMSTRAKKEKRLQKAGYTTKKGQFGAVRTMRGGAESNGRYLITKIKEFAREKNISLAERYVINKIKPQQINKLKYLNVNTNLRTLIDIFEYLLQTTPSELCSKHTDRLNDIMDILIRYKKSNFVQPHLNGNTFHNASETGTASDTTRIIRDLYAIVDTNARMTQLNCIRMNGTLNIDLRSVKTDLNDMKYLNYKNKKSTKDFLKAVTNEHSSQNRSKTTPIALLKESIKKKIRNLGGENEKKKLEGQLEGEIKSIKSEISKLIPYKLLNFLKGPYKINSTPKQEESKRYELWYKFELQRYKRNLNRTRAAASSPRGAREKSRSKSRSKGRSGAAAASSPRGRGAAAASSPRGRGAAAASSPRGRGAAAASSPRGRGAAAASSPRGRGAAAASSPRGRGAAAASSPRGRGAAATTTSPRSKLRKQIINMGFTRKQANAALQEKNNLKTAIEWILQQPNASSLSASPRGAPPVKPSNNSRRVKMNNREYYDDLESIGHGGIMTQAEFNQKWKRT